jgi:hypothetical protein
MLGSLTNTLSNIIIGFFFGVKYYVLKLKITLLKQNLFIYLFIYLFIHLFIYITYSTKISMHIHAHLVS